MASSQKIVIGLITRSMCAEGGAGGYAARLYGQLAQRNQVELVGVGEEPGLRFAMRHRSVSRRFRHVLSLERTIQHDVVRVGGGVQRDCAAAMGRRWSRRTAWLERRSWDAAQVVVANSEFIARRLRALCGTPVSVVRTGVDLVRFQPQPTGRSGAVLFAAHGWSRKGFSVAVQVMTQFPEYELWVAGRDRRRGRRLAEAQDRLNGRVRDLGCSRDLAELLPQVDAVLHPTRYDPASNLVLECMAAGVPVVTTRRDGSAEILPNSLIVGDDPTFALHAALEGGLSLSRELRTLAEQWPDSRNALELEALLWETHR